MRPSEFSRRPRWGLIPIVLMVAGIAAGVSWGDTVRFPAAKDNTLIERIDGSRSDGAGPFFRAGRIGQSTNYRRRGVMAFDVSTQIPPGSVIRAATLTLHMSLTNSGSHPVSLHRLTQDWGEGPSVDGGGEGTTSEIGDATWIHRFFDNTFWSLPGGDYEAVVSAETMVDQAGFYAWGSTPEMVADVQAWVNDPGGNYGWILIGNETAAGRTVKAFDSRENAEEAQRPVLEVEFDPPGRPIHSAGSGYWRRQCLAVGEESGGRSPGRKGRGPVDATEPEFLDRILPCADEMLQQAGLANAACPAVIPDSPRDACERAAREVSGWAFNLCSGRIGETDPVRTASASCSSITAGELIQDLAGFILTGECRAALICSARAR